MVTNNSGLWGKGCDKREYKGCGVWAAGGGTHACKCPYFGLHSEFEGQTSCNSCAMMQGMHLYALDAWHISVADHRLPKVDIVPCQGNTPQWVGCAF